MAKKNVTATRMTMLSLKDQVKVAMRGHKLLKDKQDGLMQEFMAIIHQAKTLRKESELALEKTNTYFLEAQAVMPQSFLKNTFSVPSQKIRLGVKTKNVMSVRIPQFKLNVEGTPFGYGFSQTTGELDIAIMHLSKVFKLLLQVAEVEKSAENLAVELEKTRRRVNALEYTLIPDLQETLKFIKMKLGEEERSGIVQVMAVKNLIELQEKAKLKKQKALKTSEK